MRAINVKQQKNKLSTCIRFVAGGETLLVTDRDRMVAELGPPRPGRAEELADAVPAEAVRAGWLTPPLAPDRTPPPRRSMTSWRARSDGLDRDRGDR